MDWKRLESVWVSESEQAILDRLRRNPHQTLEAVAFHESYRELDGAINLPWLAIRLSNSQPGAPASLAAGSSWNPADWEHSNILSQSSELRDLEGDLNDEATKGSQSQWSKTEKKFLDALIKAAKTLHRKLTKQPQISDELVVFISDEEGGLELIRKTISPELFQKFFDDESANTELQRSSEALQTYLADPITHEAALIALGDDAVRPLLGLLEHPSLGSVAISILGEIGNKSPEVIDTLRGLLDGSPSVKFSAARQLARLGDIKYLFVAAQQEETQEAAVIGIVSLLKAGATKYGIPLSYAPVEQLLAIGDEELSRRISEELKPGSSLVEIKPADVDEALQGLRSRALLIRQHAVMVLGDRSLGKKAGEMILPALAIQLEHENATVRRLALLSLGNWKGANKPFQDQMRKCMNDRDSNVRQAAGYVLNG